jgi:type IV pilus assembly protein PilA
VEARLLYSPYNLFFHGIKTDMNNLIKSLKNEYKGFTLVELLIVIAIIGLLAAIIVPNVTGLSGSGEVEAAAAEKAAIQSAMDTMMAKTGLTSVTAVNTPTNNMAVFPDKSHALYPAYLRSTTTDKYYTCSSTGLITQHDSSHTFPTLTSTATPWATSQSPLASPFRESE